MATAERMPEPEGSDDERFVYVVTVAPVREKAVVRDNEREAPPGVGRQWHDLEPLVPWIGGSRSPDLCTALKANLYSWVPRRERTEPLAQGDSTRQERGFSGPGR